VDIIFQDVKHHSLAETSIYITVKALNFAIIFSLKCGHNKPTSPTLKTDFVE
jgi:hypothetical protein